MWQKQKKNNLRVAEVLDLKVIGLSSLLTPYTVPLCLDDASKIFFQLKVWATTCNNLIHGSSSGGVWALKHWNLSKTVEASYPHISRGFAVTVAVGKTWQAQSEPRLPAIWQNQCVFNFQTEVVCPIKEIGSRIATNKAAVSSYGASLLCCLSFPHRSTC